MATNLVAFTLGLIACGCRSAPADARPTGEGNAAAPNDNPTLPVATAPAMPVFDPAEVAPAPATAATAAALEPATLSRPRAEPDLSASAPGSRPPRAASPVAQTTAMPTPTAPSPPSSAPPSPAEPPAPSSGSIAVAAPDPAPPTGVAQTPASASSGPRSIIGRITYSKGAPPPKTLKVDKDLAVCGAKPIPDESLVVGKNGALANVVVSIEGVAGKGPSRGKATVDQKGCRYVPHVQAMTVGATVELVSSDSVLHNIHSYVGDRTLFNVALPIANMKVPKKVDQPGVVRLKCDAGHTWMSAFIVVKPHGFVAVTGADGSFRIEGVPPGSYKVELWHETLGSKTATATVPAAGEARIDVTW